MKVQHAILAAAALILLSSLAFYSSMLDRLGHAADPMNTVVITTATGETHRFTVEIADTPSKQAQGLMDRHEMATDHGMLFYFPYTQPLSFWMKNTYIPLDMIFIDEKGKIVSIAENTEPLSRMPIPSKGLARATLEINGGESQKRGIKPGDRVEHPFFTRDLTESN